MEFPIIKYEQNGNELIHTVLPFHIINKFCKVLVYGKDEGGYQREPDPKHFNKIASFVRQGSFILPTSIILGMDKQIAEKVVSYSKGNINFEKANEKFLRVIDGQHRIKGIEAALKDQPELAGLEMGVTILLTPENSRSQEMEIFSTINSKSKRIKVDLIRLAKYDYRILENQVRQEEIVEQIAVQTAFNLNEDEDPENVWHNAIKFGIHDEQKVGIIGVNSFIEAIKRVVVKFLGDKDFQSKKGSELIDFSRESAKEVKDFLKNIWKIVRNKWPDCFESNYEIDFDSEMINYLYKNNYYIQKTLGAKAINYLIGSVVEENGLSAISEEILKEALSKSKVLTTDWQVGNTFSGYSSESAATKVSKMIKGEIEIPR